MRGYSRIAVSGLLIITGLTTIAYAQGTANDSNITEPITLSFMYPISSSGWQSSEGNYQYALGILSGHTGFTHTFSFASLYHFNRNTATGVQFSGLLNINGKNMKGLQLAGLSNYNGGQFKGAQVSGLAAYQGDDFEGVQVSGIGNAISGSLTGTQVAGIVNRVKDTARGIQISGILNYANVANIQVGLVNYADSASIQIGLVTISKKGLHSVAFATHETGSVEFLYKSGTHKTYSIWGGGINVGNNKPLHLHTVGFGFQQTLPFHNSILYELLISQISSSPFRFERLNLLNTLKVSYVKFLSNEFSLSISPTLNYYIRPRDRSADIKHYRQFEDGNNSEYRQSLWVGVSLGVQYQLQ